MPKFLPPVLPPCLDGVGKNKQRGKDWPLLGHIPIFGKILLVFSSVRHFSPVARHGHTIKIAAGELDDFHFSNFSILSGFSLIADLLQKTVSKMRRKPSVGAYDPLGVSLTFSDAGLSSAATVIEHCKLHQEREQLAPLATPIHLRYPPLLYRAPLHSVQYQSSGL